MQETILNKLRKEHRELDAILDEITHAKSMSLRRELFKRFKDEMIPHMEGEEITIYAKLKSDFHNEETIRLVQQSNDEHHDMKEMIQKLNFLPVGTTDWYESFLVLKELCHIHVQHEESKLFAEAKEDFTPDELVEFAAEFEEAKHLHTN
jgi:hypothetical protein